MICLRSIVAVHCGYNDIHFYLEYVEITCLK